MGMRRKRVSQIDTSEIIDSLGGTNAVSRICECTRGAVSQWRKKGMPLSRYAELREKFWHLPIFKRPARYTA